VGTVDHEEVKQNIHSEIKEDFEIHGRIPRFGNSFLYKINI
jgi:hypothetical protein